MLIAQFWETEEEQMASNNPVISVPGFAVGRRASKSSFPTLLLAGLN